MSLLLLLISLTGPQSTPTPPKVELEYYKLDNGLKVVLHQDKTTPQVAIAVAYHVGSKNERAGRTGFAHFFEHMMFRGTPNVPNYDIPLQEAGVTTNAFTTPDMTVYHETVPVEYLERALFMEAERMAFLSRGLDQRKFDIEREVVKNERLQSYENVPYGLSDEAISAKLFPKGHPYSWSVIGSMKDLNAATLDDLKRFFAEFYHPGNASICLSGDIDPETAKKLVTKYFGTLTAGPTPERPTVKESPTINERFVMKDRVRFTKVYWTWPAVKEEHPDAAALTILASVLTGSEAARLNRKLVREDRVALEVSAIADLREIDGMFQIVALVPPDRTVAELEKVLEGQLDELRNKLVSTQEIARAQIQYENNVYGAATSILGRAFAFSMSAAQYDDPRRFQKEFERTFAVTPRDVQRVAAKYLTPSRLTLEVQPMKPGEEQTKALLAGPLPSDSKDVEIADRTPTDASFWKKMPEPSAPVEFKPPAVHRQRLANGVEVWVVPWRTLPLVRVNLMIPVGSADDPSDKLGLAEITAVMLTQGTKKRTAVELAEAFDALGTSPAAAVGTESTSVSFGVLRRNLKPALNLVAEMLATPRHEPADFTRELELQKAGIEAGYDNPGWITRRAYRALMHGPEHPFGRPADGTLDSLKAITLDDVIKFHSRHYGSEGSKLVIAGDVDPKDIFGELEATLGTWKSKPVPVAARPPSQPAKPGVYVVVKPEAAQSMLRVGIPWVGRNDPDYEAVEIANRLIGADFLSRLNMNLRERNGYSYGCFSAMDYRKDRGVWTVATSVRADATGAGLKEIIRELDGLQGGHPIAGDEMEISRQGLLRAYPQSFATPSTLATSLTELAEFELPATEWSRHAKALQTAKLADIQSLGKRLGDPAKRVILVVGDKELCEKLLKENGYRDFHLITPEGKPVTSEGEKKKQ